MTSEYQSFAWAAHPHEWMLVAEETHDQLKKLLEQRGRSYLEFKELAGASYRWDATDRLIFLLMAVVMENAIKSYLVYENPNWVSNGKLAKQLRTHDLIYLAAQSKKLPYKAKYKSFLMILSEGFESWARYPCGLRSENLKPRKKFSKRYCEQYVLLIQSYGRKMKTLLSKDWEGAHGVRGRFDFTGDFFSFTV
ncbi:MAG: hypothetical protein RKE49_13810 [Oceanicaulis sp.]